MIVKQKGKLTTYRRMRINNEYSQTFLQLTLKRHYKSVHHAKISIFEMFSIFRFEIVTTVTKSYLILYYILCWMKYIMKVNFSRQLIESRSIWSIFLKRYLKKSLLCIFDHCRSICVRFNSFEKESYASIGALTSENKLVQLFFFSLVISSVI